MTINLLVIFHAASIWWWLVAASTLNLPTLTRASSACNIHRGDECCRDKDCGDDVNRPNSKWCHLEGHDSSLALYACHAKRHDGQACWRDRMCRSGVCGHNDRCIGHAVDPCSYNGHLGSSCSDDCDCQTDYYCHNHQCSSHCPSHPYHDGQWCDRDCDCSSGHCLDHYCFTCPSHKYPAHSHCTEVRKQSY